jgi:hypothetical protein
VQVSCQPVPPRDRRTATIGSLRRTVQASRFDIPLVVTVHPSAIVRLRDPAERADAVAALAADLRNASASAADST